MWIMTNFVKILHNDLKEEYRKFWAGELKYPCGDDCPKGCDGNHYYEHVTEYPKLFKDD